MLIIHLLSVFLRNEVASLQSLNNDLCNDAEHKKNNIVEVQKHIKIEKANNSHESQNSLLQEEVAQLTGEVAKITKKWHSSRKKGQELNQTALLLWMNESNQHLMIAAGQSWSSILQHCAPCQKKKQISESVIHSVFHEVTWQKALVKFLQTAQNDTVNQLTTRLLQQIYCPIVFSDEFDAWKILCTP